MKSKKEILHDQVSAKLEKFIRQNGPIRGIAHVNEFTVFVWQLVDSIRRVEYVKTISRQTLSPLRIDPSSDIFDPLRAAVVHRNAGNIEEAFWLVFLATHFGKSKDTGWRLTQDIYGGYKSGATWTWERISSNPAQFRRWLTQSYPSLNNDGIKRKFGNHRKYESIDPSTSRSTDAVFESYVTWVMSFGSHAALIDEAQKQTGGKPEDVFQFLYQSLSAVLSFGRMAKFDYLTMLGKLGLANIRPGLAYINGATGPLQGGRLLLTGSRGNTSVTAATIEAFLATLDQHLSVGMQALEDAICNWQKSPDKYVYFRG